MPHEQIEDSYHGEEDARISTVRYNLLTERGYSPYCGAERCYLSWPRTSFDGKQFKCRCGWQSAFEPEFIAEYRARWHSEGVHTCYSTT